VSFGRPRRSQVERGVIAAVAIMGLLVAWRMGLPEGLARIPSPFHSFPLPAATRPTGLGARVLVYTTSWCPTCRAAKGWLTANHVPFEERDIEASDTYASEMRALNPRMSIPTFNIEGEVFVGFSAAWVTEAVERHGGISRAAN